ncbi:uncharacterized protein LOC143020793 [Oratosquilla oratoria]|uniref:uncharacterized protein LOC143020793 n=1 Tax=Oratosquilla oratoria TaxID=337810 RepID=UPI003F75EB24
MSCQSTVASFRGNLKPSPSQPIGRWQSTITQLGNLPAQSGLNYICSKFLGVANILDFSELSSLTPDNPGLALVLHCDSLSQTILKESEAIRPPEGLGSWECYLFAINCECKVEDTQDADLYVIVGDTNHLDQAYFPLASKYDDVVVNPDNLFRKLKVFNQKLQMLLGTGVEEPIVIVGGYPQILNVINCRSISNVSKIISICNLMYPWTCGNLLKFARFMTAETAQMKHTSLQTVRGNEMDDLMNKRFHICATILMLYPAYTRKDLFKDQIARRMNAIWSFSNRYVVAQGHCYSIQSYDAQEVALIVDELNLEWSVSNSILDEVMGFWLSVDKHLKHHEYLRVGDLADPCTLKMEGKIKDLFGLALMDQARMVYRNHHIKTAKWALAAVKPAWPLITNLGADWRKECLRLIELADKINNYPYIGLRFTQHSEMQLSKFPRMALLGLAIFRKEQDKGRKKQMEKYIVSGLEKNLTPCDKEELDILIHAIDPFRLDLGIYIQIKPFN